MKKSQLSIVIGHNRLDTVDILARFHGTSRSAMIDNLLGRGLKKLSSLELTALDAEHYRRRKDGEE